MKILIVEDDCSQAMILANFLKTHRFSVDIAGDGTDALNYLEAFPYDLILLDVLLPKSDGISLCRRLRQKGYQTPILLLTVKKSLQTKVEGLSSGADDYLVKPFEREELLARIQSLLRRCHIPVKPDLVWEKLRLDLNNSKVTYDGELLKLTPTEYGFLELFLRHPSQLFSAAQITDYQCASDHSYSVASIRSHIKGLRHKLSKVGVPELIETVYGLGYRLKSDPSLRQTSASETSSELSETERTEQNVFLLAQSWERFKPKILQQLDSIQQIAEQIKQKKTCSDASLKRLEAEAHQLAGLLGTFGFVEGSTLCAEIEELLTAGPLIDRVQALKISDLATRVHQLLDEPLELNHPSSVPRNQEANSQKNIPQLLIVEQDANLAERIVQEASQWGFEAIAVTTPTKTRHYIQTHRPDVALVDLHLLKDRKKNFKLLSELTQSSPPIPTLVFSDQGSFDDRLVVSRLQAHAFLQKPIDPRQVMAEVNRVFQQVYRPDAQILIVDDNPQMLWILKQMLEVHGLNLIPLTDSRLLWETLEQVNPDLVILDIKMPHLNGIDLCQVIRNDPRWHELPIIVLTAFHDPMMVQKVLTAGADDVVSKDVVQSELVARVMTRLKRAQLQRQIADIDILTQLPHRSTFIRAFLHFLNLAKESRSQICVAIIDLDQFKQVNDQYGHEMGDSVLQSIGGLLRQSFSCDEDIVARWGGEEFIIGMYGVTQREGMQRLEQVLTQLRQQVFTTPQEQRFQVTFSVGVAQYPADGNEILSLYRAANAALYQAKSQGQDHIYTYQSVQVEI